MQIVISGKNFHLTESLKEHTEKKLSNLKKYFDHILETDVVFHVAEGKDKETKNWVEVTIWANGTTLHAEEHARDLYAAVDMVVDKLERQIKKYKEKLKAKNRRKIASSKEKAIVHTIVDFEENENSDEPKIVRTRKHALKPLFVEEAALQLKEFGQNFLVFTNAETERVNVIYRRKDGSFGLIDPEE
jgi:putative sigma-54 modulation protein